MEISNLKWLGLNYEMDSKYSMDWFKGKSTGNHRFLPKNMGFSCKCSLQPIHWNMVNLGVPTLNGEKSTKICCENRENPKSDFWRSGPAGPAWSRAPRWSHGKSRLHESPGAMASHGPLNQVKRTAFNGRNVWYPLVNIQKAIENGHRNSGCSH